MSEITLDVYLNGKKIGFVKSQDWYNSGRMFFVDEREENPICKGYFPDIKSYGGFDKISFKVREQTKRSPLPDGTLPLTEEELKEFKGIFRDGETYQFCNLKKFDGHIIAENKKTKTFMPVTEIKAILWLAERFNLEVK